MKAKGAFSPATRALLLERAKGLCEKCGTPADAHQFHHRRPRGMGGTRRPETASPANGIVLHQRCHTWVERNREDAYELGYLVAQTKDPAGTPVRLWDGWFVLNPDGSKTHLIPDVEEPVDLDAVERGLESGVTGPLLDQPQHGSLTDAKVNSDDI